MQENCEQTFKKPRNRKFDRYKKEKTKTRRITPRILERPIRTGIKMRSQRSDKKQFDNGYIYSEYE